MKKLLVSVLAIAGLVACSQDTTLVQNSNSGTLMEFNVAALDNATRVDPSITLETLNGFDVWAYVDSKEGTVLTEERVSLVNGAWSYVNKQYWTPGHDYYFTAIAPVDTDIFTNNWAYNQANDTIAFTNVEGTEDLLLAQKTVVTPETLGESMPAVGLQFEHLLSKVRFTFKNAFTTDNVFIVVKDVTFEVPAAGTYSTINGTWTLGEGKKILDFEDVVKLGMGESASASDDEGKVNDRFVIPSNADCVVRFTIEHYSGTVCLGTYEKETTISGVNFEKGKAYNFVAAINNENVADEALLPIEFTVDGVNEWDETEVEVYDGYFIKDGDAFVESANGLVSVAEQINNDTLPNDTDIILEGDIDLNDLATRAVASNWTPIGTSEEPFTGTFDGKSYTIKNLALVESEAKEGKAYIGFFGYAKDAEIKNVTFENVYINIPCLDIDHSQGHIGAVAGSLEGTSTIENVTVKGDVQVYTTQNANGASRVAVIAGGNAYGNVTMKNVHVVANEGSSLIANNNVGALAGQLQGKMVFENCSSNINVTANKFFAGGLVGIAAGDSYIKNCHTTGNVSVVAGREGRHNDEFRVGGIAGGWADGKTKVFTLEGCTYTGKVSGKNSDGTVAEPLDYAGYVGRGYTLSNCAGSKVIIDGVAYIQKYDNVYGVYVNENGYDYIADGLCQNDKEYVVLSANGLVALAEKGLKAGDKVLLGADIDLTGVEFNGLNTFHPENNNTFDGQGYTVSNWTNDSGESDMGFIRNWVGTIKNVKFENCHLETSGRSAIAAAKVYGNIENVTINNCSLEDSYWACGLVAGLYNAGNISGCTVTNSSVKSNGGTGAIVGVINESAGTRKVENCKVEGCTVNNTGAYGETYSGALICGMINISDSTVEFNGCSFANNTKEGKYVGDLYYSTEEDVTVTIDGKSVVKVSTVEELNALKATNAYVMLCADLDFQGAAMTKPIELWKDSTFDGMGHKISNVTTAVQGGYATSLFRGDANPGNKVVKNLVVENLTTPAGYSYAAAIWSDLQGANIEIDNVHVNNAAIASTGTIGGFVGFVSGSTTSVVVKNSTINNSNLNGGEADHKRGAVVGRAYGCVVNCENVVVENVKINDVAATETTLVGDKGYTGTVTVK